MHQVQLCHTHLKTVCSHHSIYRVHNMQVCTPKTNINAHITTCPIVPVNRKLVERRNKFLKRCSQMLKHSTSWVAGQEKEKRNALILFIWLQLRISLSVHEVFSYSMVEYKDNNLEVSSHSACQSFYVSL